MCAEQRGLVDGRVQADHVDLQNLEWTGPADQSLLVVTAAAAALALPRPLVRVGGQGAAAYALFVRRSDGSWQWPVGVRGGSTADRCEFYIREAELRPVLRRVRCPVVVLYGSSVGEHAAAILEAELPNLESASGRSAGSSGGPIER